MDLSYELRPFSEYVAQLYLFTHTGNDQCGPPQDPNLRPKFHIKDLTCDENDPNFPFYDEVHGMYHLMYQVYPFTYCIDLVYHDLE